MPLTSLPDDIILCVLTLLDVESILRLRQTCKRLHELSHRRLVWIHACNRYIIERNLPFPYKNLDNIETSEIEKSTRFSLKVASAWSHPSKCRVRKQLVLPGGSRHENGLGDIKFAFRQSHDWLITISCGIWPEMVCWDLGRIRNDAPVRVGSWSMTNTQLEELVINTDATSEACLAVSVVPPPQWGKQSIKIFSLVANESDEKVSFEVVKSIETDYSSVLLQGDLLVYANKSHVRILNWKSEASAILKSTSDIDNLQLYNKCRAVLFAYHSVLVARSRSVELFPEVELRPSSQDTPISHPIKTISYGWIDGISLAPSLSMPTNNKHPAIAILLRAETGDPWQTDIHTLKYYHLIPNPEFIPSLKAQEPENCPYLFPPSLISSIEAYRGFTRCAVIKLGEAGTSLYVAVSSDRQQRFASSNILWGVVWPGPLNTNTYSNTNNTVNTSTSTSVGVSVPTTPALNLPLAPDTGGDEMPSIEHDYRRYELFSMDGERWVTLDYVEHRGCIALGLVDGTVRVLYLV